jgi:hypothetical protein
MTATATAAQAVMTAVITSERLKTAINDSSFP